MKIKFISTESIEDIEKSTMDAMDAYLEDSFLISFDTETTGLVPFYNKVLLIILGDSKCAFVIDARTISKERIKESFRKIEGKTIIAHNMKFDFKMMYYHFNIRLTKVYCTMVASAILYNGVETEHSLDVVIRRLFNKAISKITRSSFINKPDTSKFTKEEIIYAGTDTEYLENLYYRFMDMSNKLDVNKTIQLEMDFLPVLSIMELQGLKIDEVKLLEIVKEKEEELNLILADLKKELLILHDTYGCLSKDFTSGKKKDKELRAVYNMFEVPEEQSYAKNIANSFNFGSSTQITTLLSKMGIKLDSTGSEAIEYFNRNNFDNPVKPLLKKLLNYRETLKFLSTYGQGFLDSRNKVTNRIHSDFSQVFTDTGRLSSRKYEVDNCNYEGANLQNIPHDKRMRSCFIAREGYSILTIDYSGQEIALAAKQSRDTVLIAACNEGLDVHSILATNTYRIITKNPDFIINKEQNEDLRNKHKPVLFGYFYGAGASRIADILDIPTDVARKVYRSLADKLWELTAYQEKIKERIKKYFIVRDNSYTNRFRYFQDLNLGIMEEYKALKEGVNFPIQSSGASMIKKALIDCQQAIEDNDIDARILLTVHDEIVFEVHDSIKEDVKTVFETIMVDAAKLFLEDINIKAEGKLDKHWSK